MPLDRVYPVEIARRFVAEDLASPPRQEIEHGEEDGLAGNQHYQDFRGARWEDVATILKVEVELIARFQSAADIDAEADQYDEERAEAVFPEDDLWGLDVGVAGAVMALSAMGAIPVSSCNAGGFGGQHTAAFPYVAFYLEAAQASAVISAAASADVGLDITADGIGRLFGRSDQDLHRFGQAALRLARVSNG